MFGILDMIALWVLFATLVLAAIVIVTLWGWLTKTTTDATTTDATNTVATDTTREIPQAVLAEWSESGNGRYRRDGLAKWDEGDWAEEPDAARGQEVLAIMMEEMAEADEAWRVRRAEEAKNHKLKLININPATGLGDAVCSCSNDSCDRWLMF